MVGWELHFCLVMMYMSITTLYKMSKDGKFGSFNVTIYTIRQLSVKETPGFSSKIVLGFVRSANI